MSDSTVFPFRPTTLTTAQLAAVSYLARYSGRTHKLYAYQLGRWFTWCENHGLDPLLGIQRAHVELYIHQLGETGLMDSSIVTMMHGVRSFFRFAHIDGLITADPAVYARLPKVQHDESRTQGLDRLELIRFLQVAQTLTVHHGALAFLLGINALRASEAAAVRIEDYAETLRGHRVLHLVGKGNKPATMPITIPVLRVLEACRGQRSDGPLVLRPTTGKPIDRRDVYRMVVRSPRSRGFLGTSARTRCVTPPSPTLSTPASRCATRKSWRATPTRARPSTTTAPAETSTDTASTSSPLTWLECERPASRAPRRICAAFRGKTRPCR
ncbi:tyrosine-type recombinase/integrase [Nocardioides ochotonae]|nr:site-specific integrase [Nocardioides ochotonae]